MRLALALLTAVAVVLVVVGTTQAAPSTYIVAAAGQPAAVSYGFAGTIKNPITAAFWENPVFAPAACDLAGLAPISAASSAPAGWSERGHGRAETWTFGFAPAAALAGTCETVTQMLTDGSFTDPQLVLITP